MTGTGEWIQRAPMPEEGVRGLLEKAENGGTRGVFLVFRLRLKVAIGGTQMRKNRMTKRSTMFLIIMSCLNVTFC